MTRRAIGIFVHIIAIGLAGALALGRVLSSLVYGVSTHDFLTLIAVSLLLMGIGAAATVGPAFRASRVDPVKTLHEE